MIYFILLLASTKTCKTTWKEGREAGRKEGQKEGREEESKIATFVR